MKQIFAFSLVATMFLSTSAMGHEGHDKTPGAVTAPHGGVMQDLEHVYLELSVDANGVKIYPYDHDVKPIALKDVKIEGSATYPKKAKAEKVTFVADGDAFSGKVDAKGAHRYTLEIIVTHSGKKEKTKFNVEPQ